MGLSKKSKSIISTVAVVFFVILAVVGFFMSQRYKTYKENSKIDFAMGTVVTVKTFGSAPKGIEERIIESIKSLDTDILTNKVSTSVIGRVNSGEKVVLDKDIHRMITDCLEIYSKTGGKAALTVGSLSALWDFDSGKNNVPKKSEIVTALKKTDDSKILIDNSALSVTDSVKLDLGSVGKGAACDKAARILKENGVENSVIAVGGSIYAKGFTANGKKINVGIRNPFGNENDFFAIFSTSDAFISTSGNYEKVFEKNGKTYHHLLDCTTGYPVENSLMSVSVICDNGAKSDALSTACFVLGYGKKSLELLKENGAKAIFVFRDRSVKIDKLLSDDFSLTDTDFTVSEYEA